MDVSIIENRIIELRGTKIMLDFHLADLYEVETRVLNQAVKRNLDSFPEDFMFQLSHSEWNGISSQFVMTSKRPKSALPYAFTEHGVAMLASVLKSKKARQTNIYIIRAFVAMRKTLSQINVLGKRLSELEQKYDKQFLDIIEVISHLIETNNQDNPSKIGFDTPSKRNNS